VLVPVVRAATQVRDGERDTVVLALGIDCSARWMIDPKVCGAGQKEPQVLATSTTFGRSLGKSPTLATDIGQLPISGLAQIPQLDSVNNGRVIVLPLSAAKCSARARDDRVDTVIGVSEHGGDRQQARRRR
jgi:putative ABC transport system permease protein